MRPRLGGSYTRKSRADMSPTLLIYNPADSRVRYPKFSRQTHLNSVFKWSAKYLPYGRISQLVRSMKLAISGRLSSLSNHVVSVVFVGSKKEMVRVHTKPIVAMVTHAKSVRYWTSVENPRCPVGVYWGCPPPSHAQLAISMWSDVGSPNPASSFMPCSRYLVPKPFWKSFIKSLRGQILRGNFNLHSVSRLIVCHAPGCSNSAGALSFNHVLWESLA